MGRIVVQVKLANFTDPDKSLAMPDNEPYLGRQALLTLDQEMPFSLWVGSHIAAYTRANRENLTDL